MPERDDVVRAALERHDLPRERAGFFDEIWEAVQAREHAAAVRWRRVSAVLAAVAAAAVTAAGVLAAPHTSNVADSTSTCLLGVQGGLPVFDIGAEPLSPPIGADGFRIPGNVTMTSSGSLFDGTKLFVAQGGAKGYLLDSSACKDGGRRIPLAADGLAPAGTFKTGYQGVDIRCLVATRITLRVRLTTSSKGLPTRVQLAVRNARTNKPLAFVDWTERVVRAYASRACRVGDL